jgi:hypothetical protein
MFYPFLSRYNMSGLGLVASSSGTAASSASSANTAVDTLLGSSSSSDSLVNISLDDINKELSSYPKAATGNIFGIDPVHPFGGKAYSKALKAGNVWVTTTKPGDFLGSELEGALAATGVIPGIAKKYHDYRTGVAGTNEINLYIKIKEVEDLQKQLQNLPNTMYNAYNISLLLEKLSKLRTLDSLNAERNENINTRLRVQAWLVGLSAEITSREKTAKANINYYNGLIDAVVREEKKRLDAISAAAELERKRIEKLAADAEAQRLAELAEQYGIEAENQRLLKEEADALKKEQEKLADEAKVKSDSNLTYMLIGGGALAILGAYFVLRKK